MRSGVLVSDLPILTQRGDDEEGCYSMQELADNPPETIVVNRLTDNDLRIIEEREGITIHQSKARPLFLTGSALNGREGSLDDIISFEVDSGSDRTLISMSEARRLGLPLRDFDVPKRVVGVSGRITCNKYAILRIQFVTMEQETLDLNLVCYVLENSCPNLLGNDLFHASKAIINYEDMTLKIYDDYVRVATTTARQNLVYFSASDDICLPGRRAGAVPFVLSNDVLDSFVLIGNETEDFLVVDSFCENRGEERNGICIMNKTDDDLLIKKDTNLGFILINSDNTDIVNFTKYLENKDVKGSGKENEQTNESVNTLTNDTPNPCPIPNMLRPDDRENNLFWENGPEIKPADREGHINCRSNVWPLRKIDKETERAKAKDCKMWTDRTDFLKLFKWEQMQDELMEDLDSKEVLAFSAWLQELFWSLRHIFWNKSWGCWQKANFPPLDLETVPNYRPRIDKYRRLSTEKQKKLDEIIEDLLEGKVIERASGYTDFISNPHVVLQVRNTPEGPAHKVRFTIDLKMVNQQVRMMNFPLRNMDSLLSDAAKGGRYFFSIDLVNFFFTIKLTERSRDMTTFYGGHNKLFRFTVCPQGMCPVPNYAQRTTEYVVEHTIQTFGYVDDYLSYGETLKRIGVAIKSLLFAISNFGLMIGPHKTTLVTKCINFLGFSISKDVVIRIAKGKQNSLNDIKSPTNKDELKSILGLFSWYASRANLRDILHNMRTMVKNHQRFNWNNDLESDLRKAISLLLDPVGGCLRVPIEVTVQTPFVVMTDASNFSVGATLNQVQRVGEEEAKRDGLGSDCYRLYLIQYYNESLPEEELLLPICLKELKALYLALKHWKIYCLIAAYPCLVYTDSRSVCFWYSMDITSMKIARWLAVISEFYIKVRFLPSNFKLIVSRDWI